MTELLRNRPFPLTAGGIFIGMALMATRSLPLAVIGAALIVAGLLVPFAQLRGQGRGERDPATASAPDVGAREYRLVSRSANRSRRGRSRRAPLSTYEQSDPEQPALR
jgi:hypothetical protein